MSELFLSAVFSIFIGYYGYLYSSVLLARCITETRRMLFSYIGKTAVVAISNSESRTISISIVS